MEAHPKRRASAFADEAMTAREMMKRHIRRLPILDRNRRPAGIVSPGDLAVEADSEEAGDVLERVSAAQPTHESEGLRPSHSPLASRRGPTPPLG